MPDERIPAERVDSLAAVLDAIRASQGDATQALVTRQVGLGRSVVTARIAELESAGLVTSAGMGPSTGGRAPRRLRIRAEAGLVVVADVDATGMKVGLSDLSGRVIEHAAGAIAIADGPETVLGQLESMAETLLGRTAGGREIWGVGIGVPGPVEFDTGSPVAPPIMPGWDGYPIRERLSRRWAAPTWIDNDVNLLALSELRTAPADAPVRDLLYVKIGTGIGAGLVSGGRLHRGGNGCAGDIGHVAVAEAVDVVCRCGNTGCLEAIAGGAALAREGRRLAESTESPLLAGLLATNGGLTVDDVAAAARLGDASARSLLTSTGRVVGETLATLVSFYNPSLVVLGGGVIGAGDHVLAAIREVVYKRSLPLATRTLRVEPSSLDDTAGLVGAAHLVVDQLFAPARLARWLSHTSPAGRPELATADDFGSAA